MEIISLTLFLQKKLLIYQNYSFEIKKFSSIQLNLYFKSPQQFNINARIQILLKDYLNQLKMNAAEQLVRPLHLIKPELCLTALKLTFKQIHSIIILIQYLQVF